MRAELNRQELDVFRKRVERYPTNTHWKFELGLRLKMAGNFNEAIKMLQDARNDPKHRGRAFGAGRMFPANQAISAGQAALRQAARPMPEKEVKAEKRPFIGRASLAMGLRKRRREDKRLKTTPKNISPTGGAGFRLQRCVRPARQNRPVTR